MIIQYKINNQITAPEVRVIDEEGKNLGVMKLAEAVVLAQERGLDLIEIAATAKPPVARIISFDKFRYLKEKEEKKQRQAQRTKELKHIRITPRAALNDLKIKAEKAEEFLDEGYRVEVILFLRGREKANRVWALQKLNEFIALIKIPHEAVTNAKPGGGFTTLITKK